MEQTKNIKIVVLNWIVMGLIKLNLKTEEINSLYESSLPLNYINIVF